MRAAIIIIEIFFTSTLEHSTPRILATSIYQHIPFYTNWEKKDAALQHGRRSPWKKRHSRRQTREAMGRGREVRMKYGRTRSRPLLLNYCIIVYCTRNKVGRGDLRDVITDERLYKKLPIVFPPVVLLSVSLHPYGFLIFSSPSSHSFAMLPRSPSRRTASPRRNSFLP